MNNKIRWQNFKPILKRVVLSLEQPDKGETESGLITINSDAPKNHFRVLAVASDCTIPIKVNDLVFCIAKNQKRLYERTLNAAEQVFVYDEKDIVMVYDPSNGPKPFGEHVLIKRRNRSELLLDSKIIIPEGIYSKDQTLDAEVVAFGESEKWSRLPIEKGDLVSLTKWDQSMIEVRMPDGEYMLIVHRKFLSHIETGKETIIER